MLDFTKLNDPEWQAEVRAEEQAKQAIVEAHDKVLRDVLSLLRDRDVYDTLPQNERSLVNSCSSRVYAYTALSEAQEKWLFDIARRHGYQPAALAASDTTDLEQPGDEATDGERP